MRRSESEPVNHVQEEHGMKLEDAIKSAYGVGFCDGQGNPNGISDDADRDKCAAALIKDIDPPGDGDHVGWWVTTPSGLYPKTTFISREIYDVESPGFWVDGRPPADAQITRLFTAPVASPELCEVVLQLLKEARDIPDGLYARAKFLASQSANKKAI